VIFVEGQLLYGIKDVVPQEDYLIPFGEGKIVRQGKDISLITWGPAVQDAVKAAAKLSEAGIEPEIIDARTLVPFDWTIVEESVKKTGKALVVSQCIDIGSYTGEIVSGIVERCFDYLDAPVLKLGAKNGIAPQAYSLEKAFLPSVEDIIATVKKLF
jgi:pyruvate/2-oxoglutarate/acetoin dehydrogenase E1 component